MRRTGKTSGLAVLLLLASGCASHPAHPRAASGSVTSTASAGTPIGLIAIGHSGLTGENSDPSSPGLPAPQNSWATGTAAEVDSVYQRILAQRPGEKGHVANAAVGGAQVTTLQAQAATALRLVPAPELVIIQTIDNDIRCDGTDAANVPSFGATLEQALKFINARSPQSKILLVGQLGRPSVSFVSQMVADDPGAKATLTGSGPCDPYDESGHINKRAFAYLTGVVNNYEAEQARVCAAVGNCQTDKGVRAKWTDQADYFTNDRNHLNTAGLAAEAQQIWLTVARVLGLTP